MSNSDYENSPGAHCFNYWNKVAYNHSAAQSLAAEIGLELNNPEEQIYGFKGGLEYPVRRLVVTGKDIPKNFELLLGPKWKDGASDVWKTCRKYVLMAPPTGSPAYTSAMYLDEGCPVWRPRPASVEEEQEFERQNDFTRRMTLEGNSEIGEGR